MAGKEGESPKLLTFQNTTSGREQVGNHKESAAGTQLAPLMGQEVFDKLSFTPEGQDPAFWPIRVLNELEYHILVKDDPTLGPVTRAIGEKYAPYKETIQRVRTAYSILAYPYCRNEALKEQIGAGLELERQGLGQDQVELNDQELKILSQLAAARKMPFHPERRVYPYSEVPISPGIDPFGRRHLTTEEIRKMIPQED
jgi:hypothetical protein